MVSSYNSGTQSVFDDIGNAFGCTSTIPPDKQSVMNIYLTDQACTAQYQPVCADGFTYPNSCFAGLVGKTEYEEGECSEHVTPKIIMAVKTSILKIELYGPDGWITFYSGSIPIELSEDNTQLILSEKIKEGIYTQIRITWGATIILEYNDNSTKTIEFKERTWTFDLPFIQAIAGKTRNVMIDIPLANSLEYNQNKILFIKNYRIEHNLEEKFQLQKEIIGKYISLTQLQQQEMIMELKQRFKNG